MEKMWENPNEQKLWFFARKWRFLRDVLHPAGRTGRTEYWIFLFVVFLNIFIILPLFLLIPLGKYALWLVWCLLLTRRMRDASDNRFLIAFPLFAFVVWVTVMCIVWLFGYFAWDAFVTNNDWFIFNTIQFIILIVGVMFLFVAIPIAALPSKDAIWKNSQNTINNQKVKWNQWFLMRSFDFSGYATMGEFFESLFYAIVFGIVSYIWFWMIALASIGTKVDEKTGFIMANLVWSWMLLGIVIFISFISSLVRFIRVKRHKNASQSEKLELTQEAIFAKNSPNSFWKKIFRPITRLEYWSGVITVIFVYLLSNIVLSIVDIPLVVWKIHAIVIVFWLIFLQIRRLRDASYSIFAIIMPLLVFVYVVWNVVDYSISLHEVYHLDFFREIWFRGVNNINVALYFVASSILMFFPSKKEKFTENSQNISLENHEKNSTVSRREFWFFQKILVIIGDTNVTTEYILNLFLIVLTACIAHFLFYENLLLYNFEFLFLWDEISRLDKWEKSDYWEMWWNWIFWILIFLVFFMVIFRIFSRLQNNFKNLR